MRIEDDSRNRISQHPPPPARRPSYMASGEKEELENKV